MNVLRRMYRFAASPEAIDPKKQYKDLLTSLFLMAWFVEARDPYTGGHLWRVSRYAQLLAHKGGLTPLQTACAGLGGFLHDLGKIGVPDAILRKPDKLTDEEYAVMKTHPSIGARALAAHPLSNLVRDAVHLHHERPDGNGYPFGLLGNDIPLIAGIVGVADAYDAMTSYRPYRDAMSQDKALEILTRYRGTQFDAIWVDHMLTLGEEGFLAHIQNHSDDGIRLQECPMCGPTLVVRRESKVGDKLFCRNCEGGFTLEHDESNTLTAVPTGIKGSATDLEAEADEALISRSIKESLSLMPIQELVESLQ
ncbi:MAG: HD-GYP domain-containing protein [Gammaproteobacteria bacterium]|nr:HD-GYP domain-containing protein [Gammaproteobacteria bacterium]MDP2346436.1 HD-GYP domain-containing protein [Gammaproteobacteria bacterium]